MNFLDFAAHCITTEGLRFEKCHLQYDPLDDGYIAFNESLFLDKTRRYVLVGCVRWIGLFKSVDLRYAWQAYKDHGAYQMYEKDGDNYWIIEKDDCNAFITKHFLNDKWYGRLNARIAITSTEHEKECTGGSGQNRQGDQIPGGKKADALQETSQ